MRRLAASLLLLLLLRGLALPMLLAREAGVPACCRRSGKHHCAMLPQGDGFRDGGSRLPISPLHRSDLALHDSSAPQLRR